MIRRLLRFFAWHLWRRRRVERFVRAQIKRQYERESVLPHLLRRNDQ